MKTLILIAVFIILPTITFATVTPVQEKPKEKFQLEYNAIYNARQTVAETEKMNGLRITVININSDYISPNIIDWRDFTVKYLVYFRHDAKRPSLSGRY